MTNSNPVDSNGIQITEGCKVHWTADDCKNSGFFIVDRADGDYAKLVNLDDSKPNYSFAGFDELQVQVR